MFNRFSRSRPNPSGFGLPQPSIPPQTAASSNPAQSPIQANYKPDFLQQRPVPESPQTTQPSQITSNYERARAELQSPHLFQGPMTEKQSRDLAWQKRDNPRGVRDEMLQNRRIYGTSMPSQQPTKSPPSSPRANFNGPSARFKP